MFDRSWQTLSQRQQAEAQKQLEQLAAKADLSNPYIARLLQDAQQDIALSPFLAQLATLVARSEPKKAEVKTPLDEPMIIDVEVNQDEL
jgi:predicted transcriptional regulator